MKFKTHLMFLNSWWSVYLFLIMRLLLFKRFRKVNLLITIDTLFWWLTRFICCLSFRTCCIRILFPFNLFFTFLIIYSVLSPFFITDFVYKKLTWFWILWCLRYLLRDETINRNIIIIHKKFNITQDLKSLICI